jgi:hypothetical protein
LADDAKLADARKRVARAERKALDRALALRDEAERLLSAARVQGTKIREDAKADAAKQRAALEAELAAARDQAFEPAPADADGELESLRAAVEEARAAAATAR